jgi:hypothetical protein
MPTDQRIAEAMSEDTDPWPEAHELPTGGPEDETVERAVALVAPQASPAGSDA